MPNYVSVFELQTWPNPALAVVRGRAAMLLRYDVPTYYVFREILAAALRTELPDGMVLRLFRFHLTPWSCCRREPYVIRLRANARFLFSHELQAYSPCQTGFSTSQAANFISPLLISNPFCKKFYYAFTGDRFLDSLSVDPLLLPTPLSSLF